ncbi:MAG: ferrous iron transport protein B [Candidatus Neomarinimicrobiota bacterium]|jgi:ferrous iron transport protein B|nr:ferrous iron transport protein B [Candidatus Neomarinimicrobiota bacterium]MDX9780308.1 ferrous iron transport protein B [bacterium]
MADDKQIFIALAGNPNSGKTSIFNCLAGANQKVGNFSGVTVEKVEGSFRHRGYTIRLVDLPGTYSLSPYSPEEKVARDFILFQKPDMVVNIVDATNLERNLVLTTQLMDLEVELLIVFNMIDEVEKQKTKIDYRQFEKLFGAHVIPVSAITQFGIRDLLDHIVDIKSGKIETLKYKHQYSDGIEEDIRALSDAIAGRTAWKHLPTRWLAIKLIEHDPDIIAMLKPFPCWASIEESIGSTREKILRFEKKDAEVLLAEERMAFIRGAIKETVVNDEEQRESLTEKIDNILLHRFLGLPVFLLIMYAIFQFTFRLGEYPMLWIDRFFQLITRSLDALIPASMLKSILLDGIIAGVGGVLVFLPNILILFFCISLLEATGYMARVAFVMDKLMHRLGLHGKSFIPMITGFGCTVPALMAARTLRNRGDRITTMMVVPFFSCGAKLPLYTVVISAFFAPSMAGNVLFGIYIFGVLIGLISARLLKSTAFKDESEPFVMELPPYRKPSARSMLSQTWIRAYMYLKKAGTVILLASVIIWFAGTYPKNAELHRHYESLRQQAAADIVSLDRQEKAQQLPYSFAGRIGKFFEPLSRPLGFDWRLNIALINGLAAKEIVVSTMGTIYAIGDVDSDFRTLAESLRSDPHYSKATGLSFMIFVLLYVPCIASVAVFFRESSSKKWTFLFVLYTLSVAWLGAFAVYQISTLLGL